jgi:hypothetical protein
MMSRLLSQHLAWHRRQCDDAEEEEPLDRRLARRICCRALAEVKAEARKGEAGRRSRFR